MEKTEQPRADLTARALKAGRPRVADGKPLTTDGFVKLLAKRDSVYQYLGGLWALCETRRGNLVLINSKDSEAEIRARFDLAPKLVGFTGLRRDQSGIVADHFHKPWLHGDAALEKLKAVSADLDSLAALGLAAELKWRHDSSPQSLILRLITSSGELSWSEFALVLNSGRKLFFVSPDLSPATIAAEGGALGFAGVWLRGGRIFTFKFAVSAASDAPRRLDDFLESMKDSLRSMPEQPEDLRIKYTVDMMLFFRGDK